MIKAGIIGSTGYAGQELVRILTQHKDAEVVWYGSRSYIDQKYYEVFRNMFQIVDDKCLDDNMDELASKVDVIFTATPQGLCSSLVSEEILSKVKIIDLSADFRIKDVNRYEEWYGIKHQSPEFIDEAVYGLCEINREDIKKERFYVRAKERDLGDSADYIYKNANEKAAVHIRPCKAYADIVLSGSADRIKYKNFLNRIIAVIQEVYFAE